MSLLLLTEPSLSKYAALEVKDVLGAEARKVAEGLLEVQTDNISRDVTLLLLFSEAVYRVLLKVASGEVSRGYYKLASEASWHELWTPNLSFAVRPQVRDNRMIGIIGKEVGQAIVDDFMKNVGKRPPVNLSNPDLEVFVWVFGKQVLMGLDLTGRINEFESVMARSLVLATGWRGDSSFGEIYFSGASLSAYRLATRNARRERVPKRPYLKLKLLDRKTVLDLLRASWRKIPPRIVCYERPQRFGILKEDVPDIVKISLRDIRYAVQAEEDALVSNLFWALRKKDAQLEAVEKVILPAVRASSAAVGLLASAGILRDVANALRDEGREFSLQRLSLKGNEVELLVAKAEM